MTNQEKDEILKELSDARNYYMRTCQRRIAEENGKVEGADYMMERFRELLVRDKDEEGEK